MVTFDCGLTSVLNWLFPYYMQVQFLIYRSLLPIRVFFIIFVFFCVKFSLNGWNIAMSNGCSSWVEWVGKVRISSPTTNPYNIASFVTWLQCPSMMSKWLLSLDISLGTLALKCCSHSKNISVVIYPFSCHDITTFGSIFLKMYRFVIENPVALTHVISMVHMTTFLPIFAILHTTRSHLNSRCDSDDIHVHCRLAQEGCRNRLQSPYWDPMLSSYPNHLHTLGIYQGVFFLTQPTTSALVFHF